MKKVLLAALVGLVLPGVANASTWYVAKTGSDVNSCSAAMNSATPKLTIAAALSCVGLTAGAGAGHTVEVAAGTYGESFSNTIPTGTSWNASFTLKARSGDTVILKPSGRPVVQINSGAAHYSIIQGFVLDGANVTSGVGVVELSGSISFVRFQQNEIKNAMICGAVGSGVSNSIIYIGIITNIQILNNKIHDGSCGHGIYVEGSSNVVSGNEFYNINRYGINNYSSISGVRPSGNVYDANWIHDTGRDDSLVSWAILITSGDNNRVSNNLVTKNQEGISVAGNSGNVVYNNTLYGNGVGHGNQCCYEAMRVENSSGTIVRNNVVYGNALNSIYSSGTTQIDTNLLTNPSFVNAAVNDFHLQPSSPAINAGATIGMMTTDYAGVSRPQGGAYDLGAYEYTSGSPTPPPAGPPAAPTNVRVVR